MNDNYFTLFPPAVLALQDLVNLDVSQNSLHHFPEELSDFKKLEILALLNNPWENEDDINRTADALRSRGTIVQAK